MTLTPEWFTVLDEEMDHLEQEDEDPFEDEPLNTNE